MTLKVKYLGLVCIHEFFIAGLADSLVDPGLGSTEGQSRQRLGLHFVDAAQVRQRRRRPERPAAIFHFGGQFCLCADDANFFLRSLFCWTYFLTEQDWENRDNFYIDLLLSI